jgi:hypothetical protein
LSHALLFGTKSITKSWLNIPVETKVCCKDFSEVWDDGLQIHGNSHGDRYEEVKRL